MNNLIIEKEIIDMNPGSGILSVSGKRSLIMSIPKTRDELRHICDVQFLPIYRSSDDFSPNIPGPGMNLYFEHITTRSLVARFDVLPVALVFGSPASIINNTGKILTQYADGRVIELNLELIPTGSYAHREGVWHFGFEPYVDAQALVNPGFTGKWYPTEIGIHHMFASVTGPANKKLALTYRPKIDHGRAFNYLPLNNQYGEIAIRFDANCRNQYSRFKPDEFSCELIVSGKIKLRTSASSVMQRLYNVYDKAVYDKLADIRAFVYMPIYTSECYLSPPYSESDSTVQGECDGLRKVDNPM